MSKEIPFFSARQINTVEEYERFYHTKAYLQSLSPLPAELYSRGYITAYGTITVNGAVYRSQLKKKGAEDYGKENSLHRYG